MIRQFHAGDGGADPKRAILDRDLPQFRNPFDIDHQVGLDQVGFHLDDDVGSARQDAAGARRARQQRDCVAKRGWCLVSE